jgi:ankyrin repeat protein
MDYDEGRYGRYLTEELEAGGSPNARDSAGIPAIVLAALEAHAVSQVSILLKYGADANASGRDSVTALHAAASRGDSVMTDVLLKAYANPNLRDTSALTPLMYAVMHGAWVNYLRGISVVKMLINAGADVNAVNKNKVTVLQFACNVKGSLDIGFEEQRLKIVQLLLDKGADVTVRNSHGLTALDMAKILGKSDLIALIREYSKKQSSAGKTKK